MKILPITKRTPKEEKDLQKLKNKSILTKKEEIKKFHLEIKSLWNCEC